MAKKKLDYKDCKEILNSIHNNKYSPDTISAVLEANNCDLNTFIEGLACQAFNFKYISSLKHANSIKSDLQKNNLNTYETELLFSTNNITTLEEALFELNKYYRKKDLEKKYSQLFETKKNELLSAILSENQSIDFLHVIGSHSEIDKLQTDIQNELNHELQKIDDEPFSS